MITGYINCGMQYAVKKAGNAVGYCAISIKCGTRDEDEFNEGITHFMEHTIFKGTKNKTSSVINNYLDTLGGELNAYTTKEELVIHATVLKEDLFKAVSLLLELASCPTFPAKEIEKEKGVVIDEIKSYLDSPSDDIFDCFEEKIFNGHELSRRILGNTKSVSRINSEELIKFSKQKFIPQNMALTLVANIDEEKLKEKTIKLIEKYFPVLGNKQPTLKRNIFTPKISHTPFDLRVKKNNHEVNAIIGHLAPSLYEEKERITVSLLSNLLGGPASNSILNNILREKKGWVYNVETSYTQYEETGLITIYLGCDKENIDKCCEYINKEIIKLQTIPLSNNKLNRIKKQFYGQIAISEDNLESQCLSMGKSLLVYGRIADTQEIFEKIASITSEDIQKAACKYFNNMSKLIFI